MDAQEALSLSNYDAENELDSMLNWLDNLTDYLADKGHANPGDQAQQMMVSMLIMMLDKLELEGVFGTRGWRKMHENDENGYEDDEEEEN